MTEEKAVDKITEPKPLGEAPVSLNFYTLHPDGWDILVTIRDDNDANALRRLKRMTKWLLEHDCTPKAGRKDAPPAPLPQSEPTQEAVLIPAGLEDTASFEAERLVAKIEGGKIYWKIRGGPFTKFGVTVWPEVLAEAGIAVKELDPQKEGGYALPAGSVAYYQTEDGKPKKVTKLVKG